MATVVSSCLILETDGQDANLTNKTLMKLYDFRVRQGATAGKHLPLKHVDNLPEQIKIKNSH